ncbi:LysR substrate-binding domain-containing protein [Pseudomonas sp. P1B16]|jgi:LysR family glycine cleavage system transcriptional activator|uniref:LysR substrate-binding domain-containing protein n=1 Tax=Pseudomonas capeferrum TaxID=1495066 RepID=A0ABY7R6V7_9PSED|nr:MULTISPECIES: LysR substrate-binding domain-containing protein [Pseudomonas]KEY85406.1 LysR family transcriptional regulator [Pseudomonas capeferrum]KGI91559.1 LysR family transcriptional regulator [Pseudomonas sp. H2]MCH7302434.1 LysR substrate-binding domain-containing protein [Pseudomonas capeferrum]MDD1961550.1 LysR substrate-binding domain-containing protein [Pseudomonas sp. 39004]MDD2063790.1 LysR substrate-binding domain-containing protein [Pseudomonas sp. 25571]
MKRLPPLPALYTFLVTAQHCNFTRAGQQLHITQGAVSRQIGALEAHLGYALFQRQARGLSLTREGQDWLPRVQQVFALVEQGVREVGGHRATLQLKAPTCVMRWLLPRLMEWQALRPDVPVELTTTVQHGVDFRREGFDAAVVYGSLPNHGLQVRKLFDEQLTPVCAPSLLEGALPLAQIDDLMRHMLLHPSRDEHDWRLWLQAAGATFAAQGPKQHFETLDMAMAMASQGTGVAIGDWSLIGDDLHGGRLCMPFGLKVTTGKGYYLVSQAKHLPAGLVELMDWLQARANRDPL